MPDPARTARIAILGLGEAGWEICRDLVAAGARVRAYDPAVPAVPAGAGPATDEADAARDADVVLSVNSAQDAMAALRHGLPGLGAGSVWADLNTSAAELKERLAAAVATTAGRFADVALMSPVPGKGLRTPMLASGPGAGRYAMVMNSLGADVTVLPGPPGAAATRKLIRSVFVKGMAAAIIEAVQAARRAGCEDWLREQAAAEFQAADAHLVGRLIDGSVKHAERRSHEMAAAAELLATLGVPGRVTAASYDWLCELRRTGTAGRPALF
jgi:3-hydroxyisobutyrate dehydrogenase-like beta-hydroxyacid dehydrogenase